jgi:hypothetical protein
MSKKYTLEQLQIALERVSLQNTDLSALCASLIIEKISFLQKAGRRKSDRPLRERQNEYQKRWRDKQKEASVKEERKANRVLTSNPLKVGDILVSSWGWEQTNVDFYQIISVKGLSVTFRPINSNLKVDDNFQSMSGRVTAKKDSFVANSEPITKRVMTYNGGQSVYLNLNSYSHANLWDGQSKYCSWYA